MTYNPTGDLLALPKVHPSQQQLPSYITHTVTPYPVLYDQLTPILVDKRNYLEVITRIVNDVKTYKPLVGIDIETEDSQRHQGLNDFMNLDPKSLKYKNPKKLVFDLNRTVITGFSLYLDQDTVCYYFNTGHADVENRIPVEDIVPVLEFIRDNSLAFVAHNACYEITQLLGTWGFDMGKDYLCTLTMAVSAYNDDEYPIQRFTQNGLGGILKLMPKLKAQFFDFKAGQELSGEQSDTIQQILGKASVSSWSYNGLVRESRYGYGLKEAVQSWFGHTMTTFKDTLNGLAHMGLLTGEQTCRYGADDAYWCVRLYYILRDFMQHTNPQVFATFIQQENPMPRIFAKAWLRGIPVNHENVKKRELVERAAYAETLRELQDALLELLPFDDEPKWRMMYREKKWYLGKDGLSYQKYRNRILKFAKTEFESDNDIILAVSGPVSCKLASDLNVKQSKDVGNFAHYMMQRVMLHDLCDFPYVFIKGELKTDKEARGKMKDRLTEMALDPQRIVDERVRFLEKEEHRKPDAEELKEIQAFALRVQQRFIEKGDAVLNLIRALDDLSSIEQRIKLFLNPYMMLTDPDTQRMYPLVRSELNTRRMASENPNMMQLAKRGESAYVRGFFLPQTPDHVILSLDWSQVELVLIGSASNDPGFCDAYSQIPYKDLHVKAAVSAIAVKLPGFTETDFNKLYHPETAKEDFLARWGEAGIYPFLNPATGEALPKPRGAFRTYAKGINFGYAFSGGCFSSSELFGWTVEETFQAAQNYKETFPVYEQWRVGQQEFARMNGYVTLPDKHRRTRFESTPTWLIWWVSEWSKYGLAEFGRYLAQKIQRRAGNQVVNALIQGTGATLAKRSCITMDASLLEEGGHFDAFFIMPIHDELVFSVHKDQVIEFSKYLKNVMCNHPEIVPKLKLDGTCSIGITLEPYNSKTAPKGQIELDEAPVIDGWIDATWEGKSLDTENRTRVVQYLFSE